MDSGLMANEKNTGPPVLIREATADDWLGISRLLPLLGAFALPSHRNAEMIAAADGHQVAAALADESGQRRVFVAMEDDFVAGFLHADIVSDYFTGLPNCHVSAVAIAVTHQRQGVGRQLIMACESWAADIGCRLITLHVFAGNHKAQAAYQALGFTAEMVRMVRHVGSPAAEPMAKPTTHS